MVYDDVCYYTVYIQNCICVKIQTRCLFKPFGHRKAIVNFLWTQKYVPSTENHVKTWHSIINPEVSPNPLPFVPSKCLDLTHTRHAFPCQQFLPVRTISKYRTIQPLLNPDLILPPLRVREIHIGPDEILWNDQKSTMSTWWLQLNPKV